MESTEVTLADLLDQKIADLQTRIDHLQQFQSDHEAAELDLVTSNNPNRELYATAPLRAVRTLHSDLETCAHIYTILIDIAEELPLHPLPEDDHADGTPLPTDFPARGEQITARIHQLLDEFQRGQTQLEVDCIANNTLDDHTPVAVPAYVIRQASATFQVMQIEILRLKRATHGLNVRLRVTPLD